MSEPTVAKNPYPPEPFSSTLSSPLFSGVVIAAIALILVFVVIFYGCTTL